MKKALITGITGQDGAYLAECLLDKGYEVYGTFRRTASVNFWRIEELGIRNNENLHLVEHDITDFSNSVRLIEGIHPDEIYNLAAQSFVAVSFQQPITTGHITGLGAVHVLESIRLIDRSIKFYQASSSEMFGRVTKLPLDENSPFYPRSPYAAAKLYAHWMTVNYREAYDMFACSGILFNHESPLRGMEFVTRKITDAVAKIVLGKIDCLELGNLDAKRDWGYAKEYVEGMWMMLQAQKPDTYVLATGAMHSVRDFVQMAFRALKKEIVFEGSGVHEVGIDTKTGKTLVKVNPKFFRPAEVDVLQGNAQKATDVLGWQAKTSLETLCAMMVQADIRRNERGFCF